MLPSTQCSKGSLPLQEATRNSIWAVYIAQVPLLTTHPIPCSADEPHKGVYHPFRLLFSEQQQKISHEKSRKPFGRLVHLEVIQSNIL